MEPTGMSWFPVAHWLADAGVAVARVKGKRVKALRRYLSEHAKTDLADGALHMRYTARTRSIEWKADRSTGAAVAFLRQLLASADAPRFTLRLEPGMGIVCNNVLHDRSAFEDDPLQPRLLYRARFLDRVATF